MMAGDSGWTFEKGVWRLRKLILTLYNLQVADFDAGFEPGKGGLGMVVKRAMGSQTSPLDSGGVNHPSLFDVTERASTAHLMYFASLASRMKIISGSDAVDIVRFGFVGL